MSEEELGKNDILFQIDMQLYDEFNDKLCEMNEHWGDIYSLSEIEEVEQAEKEKERKLLREAISKLQKENVELKEEIEHKQETIDKIMKELEEFYKKYDVVSKDKIKEALGDENIPDEMILTYIETLVSENNRLEDIEDRKVQIEYNNVFNKGVKSVEDKIRTKIKELEKDIETHSIYEENWNKIEVLEELLGDE